MISAAAAASSSTHLFAQQQPGAGWLVAATLPVQRPTGGTSVASLVLPPLVRFRLLAAAAEVVTEAGTGVDDGWACPPCPGSAR